MQAPDPPPDTSLIRRAAAGEAAAFRELVLTHQQPVYACTRAICGNAADAADAAQEAFIRLHRHLDQVDPDRPLKPYLLRIAANCARDLLARRARQPQPLAELETCVAAVDEATPAAGLLQAERRAALRQLVAALPPTLREVCSLFYLAGCSCREVALALEMSEGAVKVALHRARRRLLEQGAGEWRSLS